MSIKRSLALSIVVATSAPAHADGPISLPWNMRPVVPGDVVRVDTSVGTFVDAGQRGDTLTSIVSASYRITPSFAPLVRAAAIYNDPATGTRAGAVSNPVVGALWAPPLGSTRWHVGVFGGLAIPLGSGGGDSGNPARLAANKAAAVTRSSMDNSMFAVNDLTPTLGLDVAYVHAGWTLQVESTVFELFRMRGEAVQPDVYKTNFTSGVHTGYFLLSWLCVSGELRYQRYLTTPAAVAMSPAARDNLTAAVGLRGLVSIAGKPARPGVSYGRGLDDPMAARKYQVVQVDLPFAF